MKYYSTRQIVSRLRNLPTNDLGSITRMLPDTPISYIGSGAFRHVYSIGFDTVIKLPTTLSQEDNPYSDSGYHYLQNWEADTDHSKEEWEVYCDIQQAKKKDPWSKLKLHCPKIHYFNGTTGVTLMDKYPLLLRGDGRIAQLRKLAQQVTGLKDPDVGHGNVGFDYRGQAILLDLGCLRTGA